MQVQHVAGSNYLVALRRKKYYVDLVNGPLDCRIKDKYEFPPAKPNVVTEMKSSANNHQQSQVCNKRSEMKDSSRTSLHVDFTPCEENKDRVQYFQYVFNPNDNVYQIGRSSDIRIDIVLPNQLKTIEVPHYDSSESETDSVEQYRAIQRNQLRSSRYAARIVVEKDSNVTYIYAGAFDSSFRIKLGDKPKMWYNCETLFDAGTTNGMRMWKPPGSSIEAFIADNFKFQSYWFELSVLGRFYTFDPSRSMSERHYVEKGTNNLVDGAFIDFGDSLFLWRSAEGLARVPSQADLYNMIDQLNDTKPECPVTFQPLIFAKGDLPLDCNHRALECVCTPFIHLECGHVQGKHNWKRSRHDHFVCPVCRSNGPIVSLSVGMETAYWVDSGDLTHCFNPCGHVASEMTVKFWGHVPFPRGSSPIYYYNECPFCSKTLLKSGYIKLLFPRNG